MGEVYRARDTRLGRDVAIKILPPAFNADPDRLARFEREARVLAALNHPNIAAIHGIEESGGVRALVMELVQGATLAQRVARAPVATAEAFDIARQIADALEAAHDRGIVHRDLKPANVQIRRDGTVKVLDFGLAKAVVGDAEGLGPDADANDDCRSHSRRSHRRHACVYESRAGAGTPGGQAHRHLGVRLRALRDVGRAAGLSA